jgi:hypothetical protein
MDLLKRIMPFARIIVLAGLMFIVRGPSTVRASCYNCEFTGQGDPVCVQNIWGYDDCQEDIDNGQCIMGNDGCFSQVD